MNDLRKAAEDLLEGVEAAIKAGDWKVDGACDPDSAIIALRQALAHEALDEMVAENQRLGLYDDKKAVDNSAHKAEERAWFPVYTAPEESFTLDRGCYERGCVAYDERDGDGVNIKPDRVDETAKSEHEPVAWLEEVFNDDNKSIGYLAHEQSFENTTPVYLAPPKQEYQYEVVAEHADGTYTTKRIPKRQWVGLTANEIWKCNKAETGSAVEFHICAAHQNVMDFAEALEAKLKEKNGG